MSRVWAAVLALGLVVAACGGAQPTIEPDATTAPGVASTDADRARKTLADYMLEKQALERQYGFDPLVDIAVQRMEWPKEEAERRERESERRSQQRQRARLAAAIESEYLRGSFLREVHWSPNKV